jgi:hypothetical protein
MDRHDLLTLWSETGALSLTVWAALLVLVFYLARKPAHRALRALGRLLARQGRLLARRARHGAAESRRRARLALLQLARENLGRAMNRQLERLGTTVRQDLASFPHLHRQVHEQLTRIDEDYRNTIEAPPRPPEWLDAIEAVARLPGRDDPAVGRMLEDLHGTLDRACHESLVAYRTASRRRHRVLRRMQPLWRRMDNSLEHLQRAMNRLHARADRLDDQLHRYSEVLAARPSVVRRLAASLTIRTLLSLLVLTGIGAAAIVDFHLIQRPLATIGAGAGSIAGLPFSAAVSGVVLILLVLGGALFLETTRVTHLFPEMAWTEDRLRRGLGVGAGLMVAALLITTAGLAWSRDYLIALDRATEMVLLEGVAPLPPMAFHWIPAVVQSLLALALGLTISAAALPLENLFRQLRVLGITLLAGLLALVAVLSQWFAVTAAGLIRLLIAVYDVIIFLPLAAERGIQQATAARRVAPLQNSEKA